MSQPVRPKVSDPKLKSALDRVGPEIENYHANLDAISNDIKSIEQYLTASGVRMAARVRIGGTNGALTDGDIDVMGNYSGGIYEDAESIEWAPVNGDDDRWRLMWVLVRNHGELELCENIAIAGPTYNGPSERLERKPLIETSVAVRLRAHKHLAALVEEVGKMVEVRPLAVKEADEIPF
jgi:hypothetical protein